MDTPQIEPEPYWTPPAAPDAGEGAPPPTEPLREGLLWSSWRGAKLGIRCATYVIGPFAAVALLFYLALTALGLGSGRGHFVLPGSMVLSVLGVYIVLAAWIAIIGAVIAWVFALWRRVRPAGRVSAWSTAANRPFRIWRWRRGSGALTDRAPSRARRSLWPLLAGVALLVLVVAFGAGAYLGGVVDRRLAAAIAGADRDDRFWRLDDLMAHREPVPDDENSAKVVARALSFLPENGPAGPAPPPGVPKPRASHAQEAFDRLNATADNVRLADPVSAALHAELKQRAEALRIARTVAEYRRGRHELALSRNPLDIPLPETQQARSVARLLAVDAALRAEDGDADGAFDSCRAILGVGRSIGDEPFAISQLVRYAIGLTALKSTRRVLSQGEPSDAALARLQALVLDELAQPLLLYGVRGERAILVELIRRVGDGELSISELGASKSAAEHPWVTIGPWGKLWFDHQRAVALEWLNDAVAIARQPVAARPPLWAAFEARIHRTYESRFGKYAALLPVLLMPALTSASQADSRYQGELAAAAILIAAERQRRATGRWPDSVTAIDPGILPKPPADPFSGREFHLEHREGQLLIYSVGPNLKDEHGAYEPKQWYKAGPDDVGTGGWDVERRRQASAG
jgi:hypothetical protein